MDILFLWDVSFASGHRGPGSCKPGCYKKSALAYHIFIDHPEVLSEGLNNFAFGVLKQVDPRFLADAENLTAICLLYNLRLTPST